MITGEKADEHKLDKGPAAALVPLFVIILPVKGCILICFLAARFAAADALDDAVNQWSKKISSHLAADEVARVTWKEADKKPGAADAGALEYLARAKTLLARALQRRLKSPKPVEITATFSRTLKDYLFIAEIQHENELAVEIASLPRAISEPVATTGFRLDRKLLWEQDAPILDVAAEVSASGDQMLVLDAGSVTLYEQRDSKWQKVRAAAMDLPSVRDLRGRLTVTEDALTVETPGTTCKGTWKPELVLGCQPGGPFTAGRNTIEEQGWPPYFAHAEIGGDHVIETADGRTYVYDATHKPIGGFASWDDFALASSPCAGTKIVATESSSQTLPQTLAIFELANHNPVRVSDPMEMPGPITAMWTGKSAALTVVRNRNTNRYEAYSIGLDCGR